MNPFLEFVKKSWTTLAQLYNQEKEYSPQILLKIPYDHKVPQLFIDSMDRELFFEILEGDEKTFDILQIPYNQFDTTDDFGTRSRSGCLLSYWKSDKT